MNVGTLLQYPREWAFAVSICMFMSALYHGAPDVALLGAVLLIGTVLHTAEVPA